MIFIQCIEGEIMKFKLQIDTTFILKGYVLDSGLEITIVSDNNEDYSKSDPVRSKIRGIIQTCLGTQSEFVETIQNQHNRWAYACSIKGSKGQLQSILTLLGVKKEKTKPQRQDSVWLVEECRKMVASISLPEASVASTSDPSLKYPPDFVSLVTPTLEEAALVEVDTL